MALEPLDWNDETMTILIVDERDLETLAKTYQARIQWSEKASQSLSWFVVRFVCIAKPLESTDTDGSIEGASTEGHAISHVPVNEIPFDFSFFCNVWKRMLFKIMPGKPLNMDLLNIEMEISMPIQ